MTIPHPGLSPSALAGNGRYARACFARGGGAHAEFVSGLLDCMTADAETSIGGNAPYRDDTNDDNRTVVPVRVPGLSQTVATPHNGSAREPADMLGRPTVR